jgi:WD40 repeat protein
MGTDAKKTSCTIYGISCSKVLSKCATYCCFRFGHQDIITAIDALSLGRAITSGAKDGSVRIWKIAEESQLVFHGHRSVEREQIFFTNLFKLCKELSLHLTNSLVMFIFVATLHLFVCTTLILSVNSN